MTFEMYSGDLKKLHKWFLTSPKKFTRAAAMYLNDSAFGTRKQAIKYMHGALVIRNPRFLETHIRVDKARATTGSLANLNTLVARVGSVAAQRHSGWAELQGTKPDKRDKTITTVARRNSKKKQVMPSRRMKRGKQFESPDKYPGRTKRKRANAMLQHLGRGGYRRPMVVHGHRKLPAGLYVFQGSGQNAKLKAVQLFDQKPRKTKLKPWMTIAVRRYENTTDSGRKWASIVRRMTLPAHGQL